MAENRVDFPDLIESEADLAEVLSRPSTDLVEMMRRIDGDLVLLGISGKIGPDLARTALRAIEEAGCRKRVFGVSRFTEVGARERFADLDVELVSCDLLDPGQVAALPRIRNVVYLAGRKFGTAGSEGLTWVTNVVVPAHVARHFSGSRIVAFSTGAVYPPVAPSSGGCTETHPPGPVGEYAESCLGRERVFDYYSRQNGTPTALIRLNYAVDLRYGVLFDIGKRVLEGKPLDLAMGHFNTIWQGDVNNQALLALEHCASPPAVFNVTRPEVLSVRAVATEFARILGREAVFTGEEGPAALLSNPTATAEVLGRPVVPLEVMIRWQAHWLLVGGRSLDKPTHFEETGGRY